MTINEFKEEVESGEYNKLMEFNNMPMGIYYHGNITLYITQNNEYNISSLFYSSNINYKSLIAAIEHVNSYLLDLLNEYTIDEDTMYTGYKYGHDFIMYEPTTINEPQIVDSFYDYDWDIKPHNDFVCLPANKRYAITHNFGEEL